MTIKIEAMITGSFRRPILSEMIPETNEPTNATIKVITDITEIVAAADVVLNPI